MMTRVDESHPQPVVHLPRRLCGKPRMLDAALLSVDIENVSHGYIRQNDRR